MMSIALATALLFSSPAPSISESGTFSVGSLTGGTELRQLREAVLQDGLPVSVRRASLDRYVEILKSGRVDAKAEEIASNIRQFVEPAADADFDVEVLLTDELKVSGTLEQLRWVGSFLEAASDEGFLTAFVDVQIEVYRLPAGSVGRLLGDPSGWTLTTAALGELKEKIAKLEDVAILTTPRVLMKVGAPANISVIDETAYIKDFELTFFPDMDKAVVDPVVDVIQEGFFIDLRALPIAKDTLMLKTDFRSASLRRPLREETIQPGGFGAEVTIQVPEVREVKAAAQFEVKEGRSVVLSTVDPGFDGEEEQDILLIIKAILVAEGSQAKSHQL